MNTAVQSRAAEESPEMFWALDPQLPRVAASAAVDFDRLVQRAEHKRKLELRGSISKLLSLLNNPVSHPASGGRKAFIDQSGSTLLVEAYNAVYPTTHITTGKQLEKALDGIKEILVKAETNSESLRLDELRKTRAFCVALSEFASRYREMVYEGRYETQFRKLI